MKSQLCLLRLMFSMASNVDSKLLKATKFPPEFNQKVDMQKINVEVIKKFDRDIVGQETFI